MEMNVALIVVQFHQVVFFPIFISVTTTTIEPRATDIGAAALHDDSATASVLPKKPVKKAAVSCCTFFEAKLYRF